MVERFVLPFNSMYFPEIAVFDDVVELTVSGVRYSDQKIYLPKDLIAVSELNECIGVLSNGVKVKRKIGLDKRGLRYIRLTPRYVKLEFKPRKWLSVLLRILPDWRETLDIFSRHGIFSSPSYVKDAWEKIIGWGARKIVLSKLATVILGRKVSHMAGRYSDVRADLNFIAGVIALEDAPKFSVLRGHGGDEYYGIRNPKLPLRIRCREMAELLGIWSGDGSIFTVHDHKHNTEKIVFAVISKSKELLDHTHSLIEEIFGETNKVILKIRDKMQYRYTNKIIIESLLRAGAGVGRKSNIFVDYSIPKWIRESAENSKAWLRGLLECDAYLKINPAKSDISLSYPRNILIENPPREVIREIAEKGRHNELTGSYVLPIGKFSAIELLKEPLIMKEEKEMFKHIDPSIDVRTRVEKIFYYPKKNKVTVQWINIIYGLRRVEKVLREIRPPRLLRKLESFEKQNLI